MRGPDLTTTALIPAVVSLASSLAGEVVLRGWEFRGPTSLPATWLS